MFDIVKSAHKDFKNKLVIIEGDLLLPHLGISDANRQILIRNVNIVFHSAATVRFDEPLKYDTFKISIFFLESLLIFFLKKRMAVNMNLKGVKKIIQLCKELNKFQVTQLNGYRNHSRLTTCRYLTERNIFLSINGIGNVTDMSLIQEKNYFLFIYMVKKKTFLGK